MRAEVLRWDGGPGAWWTVNISESGMFVSGGTLLSPGQELVVAVLLPEQIGPVVGRIRVVWTNDPDGPRSDSRVLAGMGVQFVDLDNGSRAMLIAALFGLRPPERIASTADIDELEPGMGIGPYRVLERLGRGAMGSVYLAEHTALGRRVALKRLHPMYARDRDMVRRFFDEGRMVNRVRHEHVVEITDFISEGAEKYYVMELLQGRSLSQLLQAETDPEAGRGLPLARSLSIAVQLCDALRAVHDAGVVHRDLKPGNILLVPRAGTEDFVKLIDFGIAKQTGGSGSLLSTEPGRVVGTPAYMSPESGFAEHTDHRSDIYSFGVVLYQMVTGRLPFAARTLGELLVAQAKWRPPKPRKVAATPVPAALERLILGCLHKKPDRRPQSMFEIALILGKIAARADFDRASARTGRSFRLLRALGNAVTRGRRR